MRGVPKKPIRRGSLISPWGVGAIVPFANDESLMIAGLDKWRYPKSKEEFLINDDRLKKRLGVSELRLPPDSDYKIPAVRFPRWHYCPTCGEMQKVNFFDKVPSCRQIPWKTGRNCQDRTKPFPMIPERFIVACPEGHIDDFPIAEWVHSGSGHEYDPDKCILRRSTGGASASLTGVRYTCTCGASRSMAGAMVKGALGRVGFYCHGSKPWLQIVQSDCSVKDELKITQRGASNVWFPDIRTSIFIPYNNDLEQYARDFIDRYGSHIQNGKIDEALVEIYADSKKVNSKQLCDLILELSNSPETETKDYKKMSEEDYRFEEYKNLIHDYGNDNVDFHSVNISISSYDKCLQKYFSSISLVKKLRETRALVGFSRLQPKTENDLEKEMSMLSNTDVKWLPAVQVFGEGIFFEFNANTISEWAENTGVVARIQKLDNAYNKSFFKKKNEEGRLNPEFVLIHTFAHLLINQLSFECGYGSSSLRERLYCGKTSDKTKMYGVLIYTASGDSDGSLGGLVRQGRPGRIEDTIVAALKNAEWCSSDPICIESKGQGPDSLNLAACYNCALLPETSCENGNRLLDRGVVVGTLENKALGYFAELMQEIDSI